MTLLHQAAQKAVEALKQPEGDWSLSAALAVMNEVRYQLESALQHQEVPREPVAMIEAEDALSLADDLEAIRRKHWMHWTAQENHIAATSVRHLRLLAASPSTTRQQEVGSDIVEAIARQWDGCMAPMFDATGNPTDALDIGATIRADGIPAAAPSPLQREMGSGYEFVGGFLQDKRVDGSTRWNQVSKQYENDADVVKLYRAAAPSPLQQEARNGWRPIATAPKDGREIILREGSRVGAACWVEWLDTHDNDGAPNADGGEGWTIGYDGDEWRNPTAWQPLPAAPSTPEKAGGVPVIDEVQEAAYQRGKRAGYSEGFRAGRNGVPAGVPMAPDFAGMAREAARLAVAQRVCLEVSELPDRNSPAGWPEAMLVTHEELLTIVVGAITDGVSAVAPVRLVEGPPRDFGQAQDRYGEHMDRPAPGVGGNDGR